MAIAIYVLVLRAFFPDYDVRSDPVIRQALHGAADRLRSVHDTSMSGILHMMVPCNVPPVGDVLTCDDWVPVYVATSWDLGGGPQNYYDDAVQFFQPFGCVHTFSGYSNFGKFPPYPDGRVLQTEDPAIGFLFARKIGLATRHRWKATYTGIGLASVWAVMNRLYEITGDATVAGDRGWEGWTGREIRSIVTYPITHAQVPPHGETAWILNDGTFKAGEPFSFRGVLEGLYQLSGLIGPGAPAVPEFSLRAGMEAAILREPIQDLMQWWGAW
jgi:hypothetical protein